MSYIPKAAMWYLADIVLEITVDDESDNVVHVNLTLVRASNPDEAYDLAVSLGKQSEITYLNTDGKTVTVMFRGLRDLNVIHEPLEHGSEIAFEEHHHVSENQLSELVRPKAALNVFKK